ncbi:8-amino-7-oxononanoate synthase [Dokdonia sp. Hel_I_63]|uniref:aminotransferase class I/II-fold pyridoxal phosphate-dependent enzyme n=1 Tax=unclassified Dokdonia TaxID=2615033 RepID=UPI00020A646D|nr:aminotransferase class I/II-fold pyridoxal phosphate-dependent enzyme [Dokdonia sp. Hel_I_63]AEE18905.1 8-amino-7-oxononanoate synthase [Dokdonia sp. 4H-3-7-5]TVZ21868.1 8-amino-7-oxononanoate synthase [Dokdonia sp. Hel_I_63]
MLPEKLQKKLSIRRDSDSLRTLNTSLGLVDFSSNDYLGFSSSLPIARNIAERTQEILDEHQIIANGATGSRLLSGNHTLYSQAETLIAGVHNSETALIFNSGYDANIGFFQSVPQRGDLILYDEFIHASIRDGIQMSLARGYKFKHNDIADIETVVTRLKAMHHLDDQETTTAIYLVTESVFSMDGDTPDLMAITQLCKKHNIYLIVDEAHATGVIGTKGLGLVQELALENETFARIITFGKGMGAHGAAILCSEPLCTYLINFARSFIYTTGLPPHAIATIMAAYEQLDVRSDAQLPAVGNLQELIIYFNSLIQKHELDSLFIESNSAIHCAVVMGNEKVRTLSRKLEQENFEVKPILSPTVPEGQERLRICLHTYNTKDEITALLAILKAQL